MALEEERHTMSTIDRLIYMAHQIERNLTTLGEEKAVAALSEHLTNFWDPRMKSRIISVLHDQPELLSPIVAKAVEGLEQASRPASSVDQH